MKKSSRFSGRELTIAAGLAAFSAVVQLIHVGYQSPTFGMWIDIVAITWIMAFFLFGKRMSLIVSLVGALIITLFAPDTWLGASMKWIASLPMWLILALWMEVSKKSLNYYGQVKNLIIPILLALFIRCLIVLPLNYFYAIPIWTGMTTAIAWKAIPWYVIVIFNVVQGLVDILVAWILVFKFRLKSFSNWTK